MATIALLSPSAIADLDFTGEETAVQRLSAALAVLLIAAYGLSLLFSLKTHKELFASSDHGETSGPVLPIGLAIPTLLVVTVLVAFVSEIFVKSVQKAAETLGMSPAFVGFVVVALVGAAAEMAVAFSAARRNRLDLSVSIALGSASQIALFVAPGPRAAELFRRTTPHGSSVLAWRGDNGDDCDFGDMLRHQQRTIGMVHRRPPAFHLCDFRDDPLHGPAGLAWPGLDRAAAIARSDDAASIHHRDNASALLALFGETCANLDLAQRLVPLAGATASRGQ